MGDVVGALGQVLADTHEWIYIQRLARLGLQDVQHLLPPERHANVERLLNAWPPGVAPTLTGDLRQLVRDLLAWALEAGTIGAAQGGQLKRMHGRALALGIQVSE